MSGAESPRSGPGRVGPLARRAPTAQEREPQRPDAFISYAREQKEFVARLDAGLRGRGKSAWIDWKDIRPTADWRATVRGGIEAAIAFIFVLSPDSLASEVCAEELVHAHDNNKRIIPILRREVEASRVPPELASPNWILFRDEDEFEAALETLVDALETDLEWLDAHARLLVNAREWRTQRSDRAYLLRGGELAAAERWLQAERQHRERATQLQRDYIAASHRARTRRRAAIAAVGGVVLIVAGVLAFLGLRQRDIARSRSLAADAMSALATDPWRALERAIEAERTADTPEAVAAIRKALSAPRESAVLRAPDADIMGARFARDSRHVITLGRDGKVRRWGVDGSGGEVVGRERPSPPPATPTDVSPDGTLLVAAFGGSTVRGGADDRLRTAVPGGGEVRVIEANSRLPLVERPPLIARANLGGGLEGIFPAVQFSPDGRYFLEVGFDRTARVWPTAFATLPDRGVLDVAISPDGRRCLTVDRRGRATMWSCRSGERLHAWTLDVSRGSSTPTVRASFSDDGARVYISTLSFNGATWAWDARTGRRITDIMPEPSSAVAFSPDGALALTRSSSAARIVDASTGRTKSVLRGLHYGIGAAAFSGDDARLVTSNPADPHAHVWAVDTGREVARIRPPGGAVEGVDITPDGALVATAAGTEVRLWNARTGAPIRTLEASDLVLSVRFSPGGEYVAAALHDGSARVWESATGRDVIAQRASDQALLDASLSRDHRLATVGLDGVARVFDCAACHSGADLLHVAEAAVAAR